MLTCKYILCKPGEIYLRDGAEHLKIILFGVQVRTWNLRKILELENTRHQLRIK